MSTMGSRRCRTTTAAAARVRRAPEHLEPRLLLANYFVSPSGADAAPGSTDQPWRTLQHAANTVAAGDVVTVRAGTYAGFNLTTDGTAAARIVFQAEPGVTVNQRINCTYHTLVSII